MSRKNRAPKRILHPDIKHGSLILAKFIKFIMYDGEKTKAEKIIYTTLEQIEKKTKEDPIKIFNDAISNVRPNLEVRSRRVGGATYQVPVEVRPRRANTLAIRWTVSYARDRRERTMAERLANEVLDASNGTGSSAKRREDTHRMAEANKAFAHYRW